MSVTPEPGSLGSLFDHALALHRQFPDDPLPRDGSPYPDDARYRARGDRSQNLRTAGADAAAVLDWYFASSEASLEQLAEKLADLQVPIHRNDHITAAALRADRARVRRTGRWLVRHGRDRGTVVVGLGLLATDHDERDVPLIQTIGLLSNHFAPLAAAALLRRRSGGEALTWLGHRTAGWGRVYVVEALCTRHHGGPWLLRHACDGDYLNGYFAGEVATAAHLHAAITSDDVDEELIDHTGQLLEIMTWCGGMGMTLQRYPPAGAVVEAYARHVARLPSTVTRLRHRAAIAEYVQAVPLTGLNTATVVRMLLAD
ncbi:hypothetical protein SK803_09320 [Lentzea sp. BCCO 10_0856]|uniref:Uncharacterized protein n=1 Tax=Lentzea miocenica TaxID=3095431 RepID=A0ABU4SWW1_9PSEU|nr:hypothetical protein [Lentzea sp. BCCO 10_0856]MDX8030409.1 hypothetical protein [Lentzea sp. BCCO 10_0856]